jgi:hypothetical protein
MGLHRAANGRPIRTPIHQQTRLSWPAMKKPKEVIQPHRWRVFLLKRKAERFPFTVAGRNPQEAIERAIKEYEVPEREDFRISVQREA